MAKHITGYAGLPFMDKVGRDKIQALEDNQIQVDRDDTTITGIDDTVHDSLETDDKRIIGGINEVNKKVKTLDTQYKDITNKTNKIITTHENLINVDKCLVNKTWNGTNMKTLLADDSAVTNQDKYVLSNVIQCKPGEVFTVNNVGYLVNFYGANIDGVYNVDYKNTFSNTFTIPDEVYSFRWRFTITSTTDQTWKENIKLIRGDGSATDNNVLNENIIIPQLNEYKNIVKNKSIQNINKAIIVLTFDGTAHDENSYNLIFPYLKEKDIPFTVFCSGSDDNSVIARYHNIKNYGGEVQFYNGQPASTYEGTSNYIEQYAQFKTNYETFMKMGLQKPMFCAYSGGRHTEITENIAKQFGFKWCRTTTNTTKSVDEYSNDDTLYNLPAFMYTNATAKASTYAPVGSSDKQYKIGRIVVFHSILSETITDESYNVSWENFKLLIDKWYAQKQNGEIKIMSMSQFYNSMRFPNAILGQKYYQTEAIDSKQHCYIYTNNGFREITI